MDGDAVHFVRGNFDLAGMQATADLNAERVNRLGDGPRATHRARRAVEGGEKPVSERFHFIAAGAREFSPHRRVMGVQQIAPALVAQMLGPRGRSTMSVKSTVARTRSPPAVATDPVKNSAIASAILAVVCSWIKKR